MTLRKIEPRRMRRKTTPCGVRVCTPISLLVLLLTPTTLFAEPVGPKQATQAARAFIDAENAANASRPATAIRAIAADDPPQSPQDAATQPIRGDDGGVLAYVVPLGPEGFVIVAADTTVTPVLGYSYTGSVPSTNNWHNPLVAFVRSDVQTRLRLFREEPEEYVERIASNQGTWATHFDPQPKPQFAQAATAQWGPILDGVWHQGPPYNDLCPLSLPHEPGERRVVCCVATALAQIVNSWGYPGSIAFNGEHDRYTSTSPDGAIRIDEDSEEYDFPTLEELDDALDIVTYGGTPRENALLSFACGVALQVDYGRSVSLASTSRIADVLKTKLQYGSARPDWTDVWPDRRSDVIRNIKTGRSVAAGIVQSGRPIGHAVVFDGYNESDDRFHVNMGWQSAGSSTWYDVPDIRNYDAVRTLIFDIVPFFGWPQYGGTARNDFQSPYPVPTELPVLKWEKSTPAILKGLVTGAGNRIYTVLAPTIIGDDHPAFYFLTEYGDLSTYTEITPETAQVGHPVQSRDGIIYVGTSAGTIYAYDPRNNDFYRHYTHPGSRDFSETPRVDEEGYLYFPHWNGLFCLDPHGNIAWDWPVPSGCITINHTPAVDVGNDRVVMGYWCDGSDEAHLACIDRLTGNERYEYTFADIPSADRSAKLPAIGSDGTVFVSCRTKIYALEPRASDFRLRWVVDKQYARWSPIAIGPDDSVYTEYWTRSGGDYYMTFAALDPISGANRWEVRHPDIGTYTNFGQPMVGENRVVLFPVTWDREVRPFEVFAYQDNSRDAAPLWQYDRFDTDPEHASLAIGAGNTLYAYALRTIAALSTGEAGDPDEAGMGYIDNRAPSQPTDPSPRSGATGQPTNAVLSWRSTDPDGHPLRYDVFMSKASGVENAALIPVRVDLSEPKLQLAPLSLEAGTQYVWSVVVTDGQSRTEGATWSFVTEGVLDQDGDGIPDDGDGSGVAGDKSCTGGSAVNCDDNCPATSNSTQNDCDSDGIGDACDSSSDCGLHPADRPQSWDPDCDCATCGDSQIELCEAVGYAAAWKGGDHNDLAAAMRGLYLWMKGECYRWDESNGNWIPKSCE